MFKAFYINKSSDPIANLYGFHYNFYVLCNIHCTYKQKKKPLNKGFRFQMASSEGFEPPTVRLEGACSVQLSYEDNTQSIANYFSKSNEVLIKK